MKPSVLKQFLVSALRHKRKVLIKGPPGGGKSDLVEQAAEEAQYDLLISHPAVSDPTDYKGMPAIAKNGAEAHFLPFGDLNEMIRAERPLAVFVDDIGQAPHSVQAALMQLLLARRVNGHKISDHVVFVGATNDTSHRAGVQSILEPVKSRWDTIVELETDIDDWCLWAYRNNVPAEVIAFIRFRPNLLHAFEPTRDLVNTPSPRTVAAVGKWVADGICANADMAMHVITGAAGKAFAAEFLGFLRVYQQLPTIDQIMLDPQGAPVPRDPSACYAVTAALVKRFNAANARKIFTYSSRLHPEFEMVLVRDAQRVNEDLKTCPEFTQWAIRNSNN